MFIIRKHKSLSPGLYKVLAIVIITLGTFSTIVTTFLAVMITRFSDLTFNLGVYVYGHVIISVLLTLFGVAILSKTGRKTTSEVFKM